MLSIHREKPPATSDADHSTMERLKSLKPMKSLKSLGKTLFDVSPATAFVDNTGDAIWGFSPRSPHEVSSSRSSSDSSRGQFLKGNSARTMSYSEDSASDQLDDSRRTISIPTNSITSTKENYDSERWMRFYLSDGGQLVEMQEEPRSKVVSSQDSVFDKEESSAISSEVSDNEENLAISSRESYYEENSAISPRVCDHEEISEGIENEISAENCERVSDFEHPVASTENDVIWKQKMPSVSEDVVGVKAVSVERVEAETLQGDSKYSSQDTPRKKKDMSTIDWGFPADPELTEMRQEVSRKYRECEEKLKKMLPSRKIDFSSRSWGRQASENLKAVQT